jgi:Mpv17 / PMP22 family
MAERTRASGAKPGPRRDSRRSDKSDSFTRIRLGYSLICVILFFKACDRLSVANGYLGPLSLQTRLVYDSMSSSPTKNFLRSNGLRDNRSIPKNLMLSNQYQPRIRADKSCLSSQPQVDDRSRGESKFCLRTSNLVRVVATMTVFWLCSSSSVHAAVTSRSATSLSAVMSAIAMAPTRFPATSTIQAASSAVAAAATTAVWKVTPPLQTESVTKAPASDSRETLAFDHFSAPTSVEMVIVNSTQPLASRRTRALSIPELIYRTALFAVLYRSVVIPWIPQVTSWYTLQLLAFPIITKSCTSGVIGMMGDYGAQWLDYFLDESKRRRRLQSELVNQPLYWTSQQLCEFQTVDTRRQLLQGPESNLWLKRVSIHGRYQFRRGLSILVDGLLITGPLMHLAYNLFEQILPIGDGGGSASSLAALAHVLGDSVFLDGLFVAATFIVTGLIEGYSWREIVPQLRRDYWNTMKASWATSLAIGPLTYACFRYLPLTFRVLAVNFLDVIWESVISFMAHRSRGHNRANDFDPGLTP